MRGGDAFIQTRPDPVWSGLVWSGLVLCLKLIHISRTIDDDITYLLTYLSTYTLLKYLVRPMRTHIHTSIRL